MADISFYVNGPTYANIIPASSGIGFYGSGFGVAVPVSSYQATSFITDGAGTTQAEAIDNVKFIPSDEGGIGSGELAGAVKLPLRSIPNSEATCNIRFTHGSAVIVQNAEARIYDRSDITVGAVGVTTKMAEIIHPNPNQQSGGSGDLDWIIPAGDSVTVDLIDSPEKSGERAGNGATADTQHDWYVAISAMPDSIGSKTSYGLYVSTEYL